jgi:hypothetical protein
VLGGAQDKAIGLRDAGAGHGSVEPRPGPFPLYGAGHVLVFLRIIHDDEGRGFGAIDASEVQGRNPWPASPAASKKRICKHLQLPFSEGILAAANKNAENYSFKELIAKVCAPSKLLRKGETSCGKLWPSSS